MPMVVIGLDQVRPRLLRPPDRRRDPAGPRSTDEKVDSARGVDGVGSKTPTGSYLEKIVSLDLSLFSEKVRRLREMFNEQPEDVSRSTRIPVDRLLEFENGTGMPTGDEVLVLADHFKEDFRFFISNEQQTVLERTEKLFRTYSDELSTADRWAIQEFLFLCENEAFLLAELGRKPKFTFTYAPRGDYHIGHGLDAARKLRARMGYGTNDVPADVYGDLRSLGFHVFRRRLDNSKLSGLFIDHPDAGPCLLVNYSEDVYRQRFTAAHEAAHAIFDRQREFVVSYTNPNWSKERLVEVRAETFASAFLIPPELLKTIDLQTLDRDLLLKLADRLKVSVVALVRAFVRDKLLTKADREQFRNVRLPRAAKNDPELPESLTERQRERKERLLQTGLSSTYVDLCLEAGHREVVTRARLAEMLLVSEPDLDELLGLFARSLP